MDKNEIITLSSDEESDCANQFKPKIQMVNSKKFKNTVQSNFIKTQRKNEAKKKKLESEFVLQKICKFDKIFEGSPEIVDLEECTDKSPIILDLDNIENHSNHQTEDDKSYIETPCNGKSLTGNDKNKEDNSKTVEITTLPIANSLHENIKDNSLNCCTKIPDFFEDFVAFCGSLEKIPNDKLKLMKKLKKRFTDADQNYVQSKDFKILIEKSKTKLDKSNLYLIAKNITDELSLRKQINTKTGNSNLDKENNQRNKPENDQKNIQKDCSKENRKKTKLINKIVRKLDKLGEKIRKLEEQEVDLSDEEGSTYISLQRHRERFCQIYKKLCKVNNCVPYAGRACYQKVCFSGSKSSALNKCIEKWLNKTKKFPDFIDILKLLESEGPSIGLSVNKESLKPLATEIFEKVGQMLQRRRQYDLWDSFSGFLDNSEDPAKKDPELETALKKNFETRVKKEEEIFAYYAEKQEKERLEPEEVPEEEADCSLDESGNEDDAEIEKIENSVNERLDTLMDDEQIEIDEENLETEELNKGDTSNTELKKTEEKTLLLIKESKNNFKNCKSLKWRCENKPKTKQNIDSGTYKEESGTNNMNGTCKEGKENQISYTDVNKSNDERKNLKEGEPNELNMKVNLIESKSEIKNQSPSVADQRWSMKRRLTFENGTPGKKKLFLTPVTKPIISEFDIEKENSKEKKIVEVFDVHCCHIKQNFEEAFCRLNFFDDLNEKKLDWKRGKVFRDLTNISRLMKLGERKGKSLGLFSNSFYHRNFHNLDKPSWKKRFIVNYKLISSKNQKCALNQNDNSGKNVNGTAGDSEEKDVQNNSNKGEGKEINNFSGHGGGNEEDNNDDENRKKNGKTLDDIDENKAEEDEEEKDEENGEEEIMHSGECDLTSETTENLLQSDETNETKKKKSKKKQHNDKFNNCKNEDSKNDKNCETLSLESSKPREKIIEEKRIKISEDSKINENYELVSQENKGGKEEEIEKKEFELCEKNTEEHPVEKKNEFEEKLKGETEVKKYGSEEADNKTVEETDNKTNEKADNKIEAQSLLNISENAEETKKSESIHTEANAAEDKKENSSKIAVHVSTDKKNQTVKIKPSTPEKPKTVVDVSLFSPATTSKDIAKIEPEENKNVFKTPAPPKRIFSQKMKLPKTSEASFQKLSTVETIVQSIRQKKNKKSPSDEERVKRFLLNSPSSISITPPKKLCLSNPPSQAALQALATLRNLKGISTTRVRGKPKNEDDVIVIGESSNRKSNLMPQATLKEKRYDLPVIANVHSMKSPTPAIRPKFAGAQNNASAFAQTNNLFYNQINGQSSSNSSSLRISNVWGSVPDSVYESIPNNNSGLPGCSYRQNNSSPHTSNRKKSTKKKVEYVVLD